MKGRNEAETKQKLSTFSKTAEGGRIWQEGAEHDLGGVGKLSWESLSVRISGRCLLCASPCAGHQGAG